MNKPKKLPTCTFKNDTSPKGLARIGWTQGADIRVQKTICGQILPPNHWGIARQENYRVGLMVLNGLSWEWVYLKVQHKSLEDAKVWCKNNWEGIVEKYPLHFQEID